MLLNASDQLDKFDEVHSFCDELGLSPDLTLGIENGTNNYTGFAQNFEGLNPFPVDILIDKEGIIRSVVREYDPDAIQQEIEALLAE